MMRGKHGQTCALGWSGCRCLGSLPGAVSLQASTVGSGDLMCQGGNANGSGGFLCLGLMQWMGGLPFAVEGQVFGFFHVAGIKRKAGLWSPELSERQCLWPPQDGGRLPALADGGEAQIPQTWYGRPLEVSLGLHLTLRGQRPQPHVFHVLLNVFVFHWYG